MTNLFMADNKFTVTIPSDIGNLQKVQRLYLSRNRLSGRLPITLGNLSLLNYLSIDNNKLKGTITSSIGNCQNLLLLNLSENNLTAGTIPKQLFTISMLSISLNLAQKSFVGSVPSEVRNLVHLVELVLFENKLFGEIPSNLGHCTSLQYLFHGWQFLSRCNPNTLDFFKRC